MGGRFGVSGAGTLALMLGLGGCAGNDCEVGEYCVVAQSDEKYDRFFDGEVLKINGVIRDGDSLLYGLRMNISDDPGAECSFWARLIDKDRKELRASRVNVGDRVRHYLHADEFELFGNE